MDPVARVVVEIAGILLLGALGEFIFARTRVPDVVWLVVAGILAGPISGLIPSGLLRPGIPFFGAIALTVILSSGAFRLQLTEVAAAIHLSGQTDPAHLQNLVSGYATNRELVRF